MRTTTLILIPFLMMAFFGHSTSQSLITSEFEASRNYTVIPSPDAPQCNEAELQCLTLSQLANSSSDYLGENTELHFLQGKHHLDSTLLIENLHTFSMSSISHDSYVTIVCNHSSVGFEFDNVSIVRISGLSFSGCTGNKFIHVGQFILRDTQVIGDRDMIINGTALELIETSATFITIEVSHNYGNRVTSLNCEIGNDLDVGATAGGAIILTHSNLTIIGSVFEGNSAQAGGAIFAEQQSNITIINSTFVGNQATALQSHRLCYAGGGVIYSDGGISLTIQDSTFERNTANWIGGIMATGLHGNVIIIITNSNFISNVAHQRGGVVSSGNHHASITLTDSEFNNSSAKKGGVLDLSDADYSNIVITRCNFTNNRATSLSHSGGVLDLSAADHSSITIINSGFANNSADISAGVLDLSETYNSSTTVIDSEFTNNSANSGGGVLDVYDGNHFSITINSSKFTNNRASEAGVVDLSNAKNHSRITIMNSEFMHNTAMYYSGVLAGLSYTTSVVIIMHSKFTDNVASGSSGGVLSLLSSINSNIILTHSEFTGNRAKLYGGAVDASDIQNTTINISYSNFTNNSATHGGVVFSGIYQSRGFVRDNTIDIIASMFESNAAYGAGGILNIERADVSVTQSIFLNNKASDGGTIFIIASSIVINCSQFHHNVASIGGVLWIQDVNNIIISYDTNIRRNRPYSDGGVLYAQDSFIMITGANFSHNTADNNGGTMLITQRANAFITDCKFDHNTAGNDGGVIRSYQSTIHILESEYSSNSANNEGGVFHTDQTKLIINQTSFVYSKAKDGGVIWTDQGDLVITQCDFAENNASAGGVIWAEQATIHANGVNITSNHANVGAVYLLESTSDWSAISYTDNIGSLYVFGGAVNIRNNSKLMKNTQPSNKHPLLKEGGTITAVQCEIKFDGNSLLTKGHAERGGALKAIVSKLHVHGTVTIANNTATDAGGGMYLYHSELICWKDSALNIMKNIAREKGGGISATDSVIKVKSSQTNQSLSSLHFNSNEAMNGGGLFLEMDSKVYIFKSKINTSKSMTAHQRLVYFSLNSAQYGGAIYVSDNGMCSISTESTIDECFIQALAMYSPMSADFDSDDMRCQNIAFVNNTAEVSGNSLFGGLLDRCTVSQFAETNSNNVNLDYTFSNGTMVVQGHEYFQKISNIQDRDIDSPPVQVCFCINGQPNCSHQHDLIHISKAQQQSIVLSISIVNQINNPLEEATVLSHFNSGRYICQNNVYSIDGSCNNVEFTVSSNNDTEELILSLSEGPCKDAPESEARVMIEFSCPQCLIGFELDESEEGCRCVCDSQLFPYFTNCSRETLIRERNVWVTNITRSYTSDIHQYLIHPYCPFDYCHPPSSRVEINLNLPNGADAQCTNHRAGLLCGKCQHNFSLSLGSSHCLPCSIHWYAILIAILIAAVLAGVMLVALLLALNLTVATGTLNGIIFYANIVFANNSVFLPFTEPFNFITAFISWLNLEIGFDTCFFVGMDAYLKTLLQFAFPGYCFFLVYIIIVTSKHSMRFSRLIARRNPVATLATLVSLSYAKFLHITIASLSFTILEYPDGSRAYVWLVDASVGYLSGKHIVLFITALLIIIAGLCYTALLLFWQWLLHHQDKILFKWIKYQKLCHFLEPYHAPFVDKHRYWAGLLFLVRVVLYIIFVLNVNGDPHVSLVAIILTIGGLLLAKGFLVKVYKKWPIDVIESIMYFNILGFAALTWYFIGTPYKQRAIAYTSVIITLLFLLLIITFHVYKFTSLSSVIQKTKTAAMEWLDNKKTKEVVDRNPSAIETENDTIHEVSFSIVDISEGPRLDVHVQSKPQEPSNALSSVVI